jgi:7-alpha-hydroxysteroid dehydrogenase
MAAGGNLRNVIVITSIYGRIVPDVRPIPWNYQLAKAAEHQMIRVLAQELAPHVRVNGVELGGVLSDRAQAAQDEPGFLDGYSAKTLLKRMVLPEEVPGAVLFLLSDAAAGMTGGIIPVNGGYGIT